MGKKGGGKSKGGGFEREVCKKLSKWISNGKEDDLFWRSAMSGGRATVQRKKGKILKRQAGDITATAPEGHIFTDYWYVECKFYKTLNFQGFMFSQRGPLAEFWRKAKRDAKRYDRIPMMIVKENFSPVIVIVPAFALGKYLESLDNLDFIRCNIKGKKFEMFFFEELLSVKFKTTR